MGGLEAGWVVDVLLFVCLDGVLSYFTLVCGISADKTKGKRAV